MDCTTALDELLDRAHDAGGMTVAWGITPNPATINHGHWVKVAGIPGQPPITHHGRTFQAAASIVLNEWTSTPMSATRARTRLGR